MIVLRIEHKIANYTGWKKAFENDPIDRKQSGVKKYRIYRPVGDEAFVIIDLEFEHLEQAQATKAALENIFPKIEGSIIFGVQLKILEVIETVEI
ncbi:MAG: hypothetical protein KDC28_12705 [Saprospiraceae bacterium]|nr:hypothetical protein [Saprospiraceae bacterium]MCB9321453.1 hypothetical protein [Lewinellaceae bacterium]